MGLAPRDCSLNAKIAQQKFVLHEYFELPQKYVLIRDRVKKRSLLAISQI